MKKLFFVATVSLLTMELASLLPAYADEKNFTLDPLSSQSSVDNACNGATIDASGEDCTYIVVDNNESVSIGDPPWITITAVVDTDGDGVPDDSDNCINAENDDQRDTNSDGYGNRCDPDLNNDEVVTVTDFLILRDQLNKAGSDADLNGDGLVTVTDFLILRSYLNQPPGPSGVVPQCAAGDGFGYADALSATGSTLSVWLQNSAGSSVTVNGVDNSNPILPFTFNWGDGNETTGWFPQEHSYSDTGKNYIVTVTAHYSGQATSDALLLVRFEPVSIRKVVEAPALAVTFPNENVILGTRLYSPPLLSHFDDSFFSQVSREVVEYVLTVAATLQYEYVNHDLFLIDGGFRQVVLLDTNITGGMYSLWYTNPVAFGAGTTAFSGTPAYSSFFHEMGHNVTLNSPADLYYGGRIDGQANAIYSETMAQIVAHVTAYDIVNQGVAMGLSCDLIFDIRENALQTARFVRQQFDSYIAAGMPFASWNIPSTPTDETFRTFMTLAYVFLNHAQNDGNGFSAPLKRMMLFLQNTDNVLLIQSVRFFDTAAADMIRATLMVTAISYAFETNLSAEFQALNFPVDGAFHDQLYNAAP